MMRHETDYWMSEHIKKYAPRRGYVIFQDIYGKPEDVKFGPEHNGFMAIGSGLYFIFPTSEIYQKTVSLAWNYMMSHYLFATALFDLGFEGACKAIENEDAQHVEFCFIGTYDDEGVLYCTPAEPAR